MLRHVASWGDRYPHGKIIGTGVLCCQSDGSEGRSFGLSGGTGRTHLFVMKGSNKRDQGRCSLIVEAILNFAAVDKRPTILLGHIQSIEPAVLYSITKHWQRLVVAAHGLHPGADAIAAILGVSCLGHDALT